MEKNKSLIMLRSDSARNFFLKHESYCSIDLPSYFSFTKLLKNLSIKLNGRELSGVSTKNKITKLDDVNHILYINKDGKLSWRPLPIIHPLIYISLVNKITEKNNWRKIKKRFSDFQKNPKIRCLSIPVRSQNKQSDKAQQVLHWWEKIEQESIALSLEYSFVFDTDIADCYGSIYTHSIAWAIETKDIAKDNHEIKLLGNFIDKSIQAAQHQQTNGIPQGSILMDFIAEMVLGYIDELLTTEIENQNIDDYCILRYRDDYRIFVNNLSDGEAILKILSEVLRPFGLKLNSNKTKYHDDIIMASIKNDKIEWLQLPNPEINNLNLQKHILLIKQHSLTNQNSGSLTTALNNYQKRLSKEKVNNIKRFSKQIISIVTDIAYHNPKSISVCCAIISKFLILLDNEDYLDLSRKIYSKLERVPNSGFAQIWLQRMLKSKLLLINSEIIFSEPLCQLVLGQKLELWNHNWITDKKLLNILEQTPIFNKNTFDSLDAVINIDEIDLFAYTT